MEAEDLTIDNSCQRKTLEYFGKHFPDQVCVVLLLALIVKSIQLIDFSILMISPQDSDPAFMFDFKEQNIKKCFYAIEPSIDVISHKEIVGILGRK